MGRFLEIVQSNLLIKSGLASKSYKVAQFHPVKFTIPPEMDIQQLLWASAEALDPYLSEFLPHFPFNFH